MTFLFRPVRDTDNRQLHGEAHHLKQMERPRPTELNYGPPPGRVPKMYRLHLSGFGGFAQHATQQYWSGYPFCAFLPPLNLARPAMVTNRGTRSVSSLGGFGSSSASSLHIPSVFVPRSVS